MARSIYFDAGTKNEQRLLEDLVIESIQHKGQNFYYIPRRLVAKDEILGEDRMSEFKQAFGIEMYLETVDGFEGAQSFMSKFGLQIEQSATLTLAKRTWEMCVGRYGATILPDRPCEGDLIYYPTTDTLLEIKYVKYQDPFYQLGKTYVYKLQVETFQYSSEHIDTGMSEIDSFESLKSFDLNPEHTEFAGITKIQITNQGSGYTDDDPPFITVVGGGVGVDLVGVIDDGKLIDILIKDGGYGFNEIPELVIDAPSRGTRATAIVTEIKVNTDMSQSYGDNNRFKNEALDVLFSEENPFGEIK